VIVPIDNPSFESGTTGWGVWGRGYLSSVVDSRATDGTHVLQVNPLTATDSTFGAANVSGTVMSPLPSVTLSADIALQQPLGLPLIVPTITVGIWNYNAGGPFYCSTTVTPNRDGSMQHVVLGPCAVPSNLALGLGFEENYTGPNDLTFIVDNVVMTAG
jgi:hypothetical protein